MNYPVIGEYDIVNGMAQDSLLLAWFRWHYGDGFANLLVIARNFVAFGLHFFSVPELARSFFAPWKGIAWQTKGKAWLSSAQLDALWGNIISRLAGAVVRSIAIALGLAFTLGIICGVAGIVLLWLLAPAVVVFLPIIGFRLLW